MAEAFTSLSSDLPAGLWALLVVGSMLAGATILFLWWELFFRVVGGLWRRALSNKPATLDDDGIPQHRR